MADQDQANPGNGSGGDDDAPQAATLAQYIKDLSVESPSAPQVFRWQEQPQLNVNFSINVEKADEGVHEVVLKIDVSARSQSGVHFLIDLSYGGLFGLRNFPEEALAAFLLAEAPRLLFPFARQIVADATQQTGFPPLLLDPIDFGAAYMQQIEAAQAGAGDATNGGDGTVSEPAGENSEG
jgi:preprotein translocase subunit SecB